MGKSVDTRIAMVQIKSAIKAIRNWQPRKFAGLAKDSDAIGAGSGSTVYLTLFALA